MGEILGKADVRELSHLNKKGCFTLKSASTGDVEYLNMEGTGFDTRFTALQNTPADATVTIVFTADAHCSGNSLYGSVVDYPISISITDAPSEPVKYDPYMEYNYSTIDAIRAAKGDTLTIDAGHWISFMKKTYEELALKPNLSLTVNYRFEDKDYSVTIPAGADLSEFMKYDHSGYRFVDSIFPGKLLSN